MLTPRRFSLHAAILRMFVTSDVFYVVCKIFASLLRYLR